MSKLNELLFNIINKVNASVKTEAQTFTEEQKIQARDNIGAVSMEEVEEMLGIKEEFSITGDVVEFDLDIEPGTELEVISKIHRDSTWGESNKLVLHQVSGTNFVDLSSYLGGAGTVFEVNGLTATINTDSTVTIRGTNSSTDWTKILTIEDWYNEYSKRIYPAGTYKIPSGLAINIRAAQYPTDAKIEGLTGNLQNTFTATESFRIVAFYYAVAGGVSVDKTIPLGLFRGEFIPESGYEYIGNLYTVTFDRDVYDGEYNWSTGELKDADGNTVSYYESQHIEKLSGINYFWTGFGENTISNVSEDNLERVVIRLGESAPEETVPSICDFTLIPTTPEAMYYLQNGKVTPGGSAEFQGHEIPLITTKGMVKVVDAQGNVTLEKYVDALINWQDATDLLTNRGIHKVWSEKFYFTKEPVLQEDFTDIDNSLYTFEFSEEDFQNTGLPAKLDNIPIVSPCFYTGADAANKLNSRVWYGVGFPATFSWDGTSGKYIFKVRGVHIGGIMAQLQKYTKGYFYYQLETPYDVATTVAMGVSSGDSVTFTVDDSDWKTYLDGGLYVDAKANVLTEIDAAPTGFVYVPRNAVDACDGMINAARMLNNTGSTGGDATVQGYSWIGEGDGSTDYTSKIQSKLDVLHSVTNGGTIYLGPGTYKISGNLFVYDNTRIIGDGQTIIEQTAENTHALILSGSNITIRDLTVKLSGECTNLTACIYVNSENHPSRPDKYDSNLPINLYAQNITIENVSMVGAYTFDNMGGYSAVSDAYENYKGIGIGSGQKLFFNYAHVDNVHAEHLMAGVYGSFGSNYFNITSEFCKYGLYIVEGGNNTYFVDGHSYYALDENGNHISMSDAIAYVEYDSYSTYHLRTYDMQGYRTLAFLSSRTYSNKIDISLGLSTQHGLWSSHPWNILKWFIVDYGRANVYNDNYKHTPFHIGSRTSTIANAPQFELSNPVIQNVLSGAGVWGNISANTEFRDYGISLRDVCRYPSEKTVFSNHLPCIISKVAPSIDNPIEIIIDYSNRPVIGVPNYFIQFYQDYVASDYVVYFDTTNTGEFNENFVYPVTGNTNVTEFFDYPQIGDTYTTYRMKIRFTKPLQIDSITNPINGETFSYNPEGLIGICNIGMTVNDYTGRSFLGECGGSLYGNVDMHQNTLKNLAAPVDAGDAVSKAYLEERITGANEFVLIDRTTGKKYNIYVDNGKLVMDEEVE